MRKLWTIFILARHQMCLGRVFFFFFALFLLGCGGEKQVHRHGHKKSRGPRTMSQDGMPKGVSWCATQGHWWGAAPSAEQAAESSKRRVDAKTCMVACAKIADQRETEAAIVACFDWIGADRARACATDLAKMVTPIPYTADKRQPMAPQTWSETVGTFSGTSVNLPQRLYRCTRDLFWAEDLVSSSCWGKMPQRKSRGLGGFGIELNQVQQGSGKGSGEDLGGVKPG